MIFGSFRGRAFKLLVILVAGLAAVLPRGAYASCSIGLLEPGVEDWFRVAKSDYAFDGVVMGAPPEQPEPDSFVRLRVIRRFKGNLEEVVDVRLPLTSPEVEVPSSQIRQLPPGGLTYRIFASADEDGTLISHGSCGGGTRVLSASRPVGDSMLWVMGTLSQHIYLLLLVAAPLIIGLVKYRQRSRRIL